MPGFASSLFARLCHLRPDLVLVYRKWNTDVLELIRIGTHAQLAI
ncbi:MAG: type II toxin-antitoxin system mRNA interferase toxin, RelE/StbE family [Gammaproteobacteria bacterium]|nr:type II toxin-antitoxin system mRNA interferase toxin, RelE/StbE family [Gammaproteobacteria bacterium]